MNLYSKYNINVMKYITTLLLLSAVLLLGACGTTGNRSTNEADPAPTGGETADSVDTGSGLLMDRYTSGEIPGLRD